MTTLATPLDSLSSLLSRTYKWVRRVFWTALLVATVVLVLEAVHLFELLARIHPVLAWAVMLAMAVPLLGWACYRLILYLRNPRVLVPPDLPPVEAGWNRRDQERFRAFAVRYLRRQESNPRLPEELRARIPDAIETIETHLPAEDQWEPVRAARKLTEQTEDALGAILAPLDAEAKRLIRRAAVEVAVATAVSPSILMDALITLTRNIDLMSRIANLYYGRPGLVGTLRILRDVFASAITAGALEIVSDHVTGAISEMAGSWTSRLLGPLGQGAVNGVVTMRFGAATRMRCRSLGTTRIPWRPWRLNDYRRAASKLFDWLKADMGPGFVNPLARWFSLSGTSSPEAGGREPAEIEPGRKRFWDRLFPRKREAGKAESGETSQNGKRRTGNGDPLLDSDLME